MGRHAGGGRAMTAFRCHPRAGRDPVIPGDAAASRLPACAEPCNSILRRPGRQSRGLLASPLAGVRADQPLGPGSPLRGVRDDGRRFRESRDDDVERQMMLLERVPRPSPEASMTAAPISPASQERPRCSGLRVRPPSPTRLTAGALSLEGRGQGRERRICDADLALRSPLPSRERADAKRPGEGAFSQPPACPQPPARSP